jgi:predicted small secreted protein
MSMTNRAVRFSGKPAGRRALSVLLLLCCALCPACSWVRGEFVSLDVAPKAADDAAALRDRP